MQFLEKSRHCARTKHSIFFSSTRRQSPVSQEPSHFTMNFTDELSPVVSCDSNFELTMGDKMQPGELPNTDATPFPAKTPPAKGQDPPKRCVSAYNLFFQVERQRLISEKEDHGPYTRVEVYSIKIDKATRVEKSKRPHRKMHGMISFTDLAKTIAQKWKDLNKEERAIFEERAEDEKKKYAIELEEWLLRQVPTQPIRKRLSALRRGSLSKYISHRKETIPTPPRASPVTAFSSQSVHAISPYSSSSSIMSSPVSLQSDVAAPPTVTPDQGNRRQVQIERARNLQRLYQMQIDLYNEQMRIHDECKADMAAFCNGDLSLPEPDLPFTPPFDGQDDSHWDAPMGSPLVTLQSHFSQFHQQPDLYEHHAMTTAYVPSPFHCEGGRVSPYNHPDTKVFA